MCIGMMRIDPSIARPTSPCCVRGHQVKLSPALIGYGLNSHTDSSPHGHKSQVSLHYSSSPPSRSGLICSDTNAAEGGRLAKGHNDSSSSPGHDFWGLVVHATHSVSAHASPKLGNI